MQPEFFVDDTRWQSGMGFITGSGGEGVDAVTDLAAAINEIQHSPGEEHPSGRTGSVYAEPAANG